MGMVSTLLRPIKNGAWYSPNKTNALGQQKALLVPHSAFFCR